jgi:hypothetical protein
MKKLIYFSFASSLAIPSATATEVADPLTMEELLARNLSLQEHIEMTQMQAAINASLKDQESTQLRQDLLSMTQERDKEQTTKVALQRLTAAMGQEQREAKELTAELLDLIFEASYPQPDPAFEPNLPEVTGTGVTGQKEKDQSVPPLSSSQLIGPSSQTAYPPTSECGTTTEPTPYTSHQKDLLPLWLAGKIGPKAWAALGGNNASLAGALAASITCNKGFRERNFEISCLKERNFTLLINGRKQDKIHKF